MNFGGPLLYNRETKCLNCPQKYGCVKYLDSLEKRQNIVSASTNLVSSTPNIKVEEQKVSEVKSESSELLSSITGAFEKINQDLVKQNAYLQGALASMNEELQKIKCEIAEVKATSESKEATIPAFMPEEKLPSLKKAIEKARSEFGIKRFRITSLYALA